MPYGKQLLMSSKVANFNLSYRQPIYVGDGYVEYECMELKHDNDMGKIFFISFGIL